MQIRVLLSQEKSVRGSKIMEMILEIKSSSQFEIYFTWSDICYLNLYRMENLLFKSHSCFLSSPLVNHPPAYHLRAKIKIVGFVLELFPTKRHAKPGRVKYKSG